MSTDRRRFVGTLVGAAIVPLSPSGPLGTLINLGSELGSESAGAAKGDAPRISSVLHPPTATRNRHYPSNRAPLLPERFIKLPVGAVTPRGWLRRQLELQCEGLTGHLGEISKWLSKKDNAWLSKDGKGKHGWEELPYWLKGYGNIAYVLNDAAMIRETKFWLDAVIENQRPNGDFGPDVLKGQGRRTPSRDLWTNMPMLFCLQSYYEHANDPRVLRLMERYFAWQRTIPDDQFLKDYWEHSRGGDNLYSVYWLYNRNGDPSLLELAEKIHRATANWAERDKLPNLHNVNVAQGFREPATWWLQSHDQRHLNATYNDFELIRQVYGQVPGGMFGADENARPGYDDPRQAIETCGMVEQMTSNGLLLRFTGDSRWADHTEDVAFNTFPAAFTDDYRALRYLVAPNMVVSDSRNHAPGIANDGPFLMMNPFSSRCCQHNHAAGWVYNVENSWMATPDDGLAAQLYGDSEVRARVGEGVDVRLVSDSRYPFEEQVRLTVHTPQAVEFPLYLRVPRWCRGAALRINGQRVAVDTRPGEYLRIARRWRQGDRIVLDLPMELSLREWRKNKNSVSVDYGPLTFSLAIAERHERRNGTETAQNDAGWQEGVDQSKWPAFEIFAASPWNYALQLDEADPRRSFTVVRKAWPTHGNPFATGQAPIELRASGRRLPAWGIDEYGLCAPLPQSPVTSEQPVEQVKLVPMGSARLRVSAFPRLG
ncbi:MAG: beta-L-arabinofuranosidase domain-containing protein [Gemmatimonadaceae bacterium]